MQVGQRPRKSQDAHGACTRADQGLATRQAGGAGRPNIIDQQNVLAIQLSRPTRAGPKRARYVSPPLRGMQGRLAPRVPAPKQDSCRAFPATRACDCTREELGLVVPALPQPGGAQRHRHDQPNLLLRFPCERDRRRSLAERLRQNRPSSVLQAVHQPANRPLVQKRRPKRPHRWRQVGANSAGHSQILHPEGSPAAITARLGDLAHSRPADAADHAPGLPRRDFTVAAETDRSEQKVENPAKGVGPEAGSRHGTRGRSEGAATGGYGQTIVRTLRPERS